MIFFKKKQKKKTSKQTNKKKRANQTLLIGINLLLGGQFERLD